MARPQRKNAEYFSHDANLRNDPRIRALRTRFGLTGYAVYCMLLEILTGADGFSVQWDEFSQEIYAGDVGVSVAEMQDIVNFCCKIQILALNAEMLSCAKLIDSLRPLLEKRENLRQKHREKTTLGNVSEAETRVSEAETRVSEAETRVSEAETRVSEAETRVSEAEIPQSKVKHSKVKHSKVKESKVKESRGEERERTRADTTTAQFSQRIPETELASLRETCVMSGVPPEFTERLWNHYEATKRLDGFWIDSNGHIISNPAKKIVALWQTERAKNGNSNSNAANGMRPYPGKYDQYDNPSPSKSVYYDKYGGL
jgi:hypothetical protein